MTVMTEYLNVARTISDTVCFAALYIASLTNSNVTSGMLSSSPGCKHYLTLKKKKSEKNNEKKPAATRNHFKQRQTDALLIKK
jgi:hypothetical protein